MSKSLANGPVALLVSGFSAPDPTRAQAGITAAHAASDRLRDALLAHESRWSVRSLSPRDAAALPDRRAFKSAIRKAMQEGGGGLLLALTLDIVSVDGKPTIVASQELGPFPEADTLEMDWLRSELQDAQSSWLIVALDVRRTDVPVEQLFDLLDVGGYDRLLVVTESGRGETPPWAALSAILERGSEISIDLGELFDVMSAHCRPERVALNGEPATPLQPAEQASQAIANPTIPLGAYLTERRAPPSAPAPPELLDTTLPGRFQLVRELGRGAHGVVYAARQLAVNRLVAVKVFNHLAASHHRYLQSHFLDEIQTIGRLDHPNIVRILQADRTPDGRLFYAMELVDGPTLDQLLKDQAPLSTDRAVNIIRQVLQGLHAAHAAGVIHADVKPDNIAVREDEEDGETLERPVLLDFGVARLKTKNPNRTSQALGASTGYMAPEQAFEGVVDVRSDLFTTALVLYEMLTGWQRAELGDFIPPLTPKQIRDPELLGVLRRGLSYDPGQRFQSAREFLDALAPEGDVTSRVDERINPFHFLTEFSESDRWRFHGRVLATAQLTDLVVYNPFVVLIGPDGVGRSSLLRAGVTPRLADLRVQGVYVPCVDMPSRQAADSIAPGALDLRNAVDAWFTSGNARLVLILDDLDALLTHDNGQAELLTLFSMLQSCHRAYPERFGALFVVEPQNLGMLSSFRHGLEEAPPVMRLGPLTLRGCREALMRPFDEFDLGLDTEALETLVHHATQTTEGEDGPTNHALPHLLQLAGGLLFEDFEREGSAALKPERIRAQLEATPMVHLWFHRVLERIVSRGYDLQPLSALLKAFAEGPDDAHVRPLRNEAELGDMLMDFDRGALEELCAEGLIVRIARPGVPLAWRLAHHALLSTVNALP